jgi:hypothetical protein
VLVLLELQQLATDRSIGTSTPQHRTGAVSTKILSQLQIVSIKIPTQLQIAAPVRRGIVCRVIIFYKFCFLFFFICTKKNRGTKYGVASFPPYYYIGNIDRLYI